MASVGTLSFFSGHSEFEKTRSSKHLPKDLHWSLDSFFGAITIFIINNFVNFFILKFTKTFWLCHVHVSSANWVNLCWNFICLIMWHQRLCWLVEICWQYFRNYLYTYLIYNCFNTFLPVLILQGGNFIWFPSVIFILFILKVLKWRFGEDNFFIQYHIYILCVSMNLVLKWSHSHYNIFCVYPGL